MHPFVTQLPKELFEEIVQLKNCPWENPKP